MPATTTPPLTTPPNTTSSTASATPPTTAPPAHLPTLEQAAMKTVRNYSWISAAVGLIPLPALDIVALIGVQLKMLSDLAGLYKIDFTKNLGKESITALIGGGAPIAGSGFGYLVRSLPVIGPAIGLFAVPAFAGASTYAVGRVFIMHFESGGTLLTFDPLKVRDHYDAELQAHLKAAPAPAVG